MCWSAINGARHLCTLPATRVIARSFPGMALVLICFQDGVDAARLGDGVLVTNGFYDRGSILVKGTVLSNRVAVLKPVHIESVNGPRVTIIEGINGYSYASTTRYRTAGPCRKAGVPDF